MKRIMTFSMALLLVISAAFPAYADDTVYTEGTLYYTINNNSITVTGCFGTDEIVEIPNQIAGIPVNVIATGAFSENFHIKKIILPDTITTIEEGAFSQDVTVVQKQGDSSEESSDSTESSPAPSPTAEPAAEATAAPTASPAAATSSPTATTAPSADYNVIVIQSGDSTDDASDSGSAMVDEANVYLEEELEEEPVATAAAEAPETNEPALEQAEDNSISPAPFIIIGVIAAAGIAAAVIVLKKKK